MVLWSSRLRRDRWSCGRTLFVSPVPGVYIQHIVKSVYISDDQIDMKKYLKKVTKVAIKGFQVISDGVLLGVIDELEEFPSQIMAKVNGENRTDFMFPLVESYILNVDFKGKAIQVCLPDGLIDI